MALDNTRRYVYNVRTEVEGLHLTVTVTEQPDSSYDKVALECSLTYLGREVCRFRQYGSSDYDSAVSVEAFSVAKLLSGALYGEVISRLPMSPPVEDEVTA